MRITRLVYPKVDSLISFDIHFHSSLTVNPPKKRGAQRCRLIRRPGEPSMSLAGSAYQEGMH